MKTLRQLNLLFVIPILLLMGTFIFAAFATDDYVWTQHLEDSSSRVYPYFITNNGTCGRYVIHAASTGWVGTPIDVRGKKRLMLQWTSGIPSETSATWDGGSLSLWGSSLATDDPDVSAATYMTTEGTYTSRLAMKFVQDSRGVLINNATYGAYQQKATITSTTPGLQYVDTEGIGWIVPKVASKTSGVTHALYFNAE